MHLYVRLLCCWDGNKSKFPAYELIACFTVHSLKKGSTVVVGCTLELGRWGLGEGGFIAIPRALNGRDYRLQKNLLPSVCKGNEKLMRLDSPLPPPLFFSSQGSNSWEGSRVGRDSAIWWVEMKQRENVWKSLGGELSQQHTMMLFPNDVTLHGC